MIPKNPSKTPKNSKTSRINSTKNWRVQPEWVNCSLAILACLTLFLRTNHQNIHWKSRQEMLFCSVGVIEIHLTHGILFLFKYYWLRFVLVNVLHLFVDVLFWLCWHIFNWWTKFFQIFLQQDRTLTLPHQYALSHTQSKIQHWSKVFITCGTLIFHVLGKRKFPDPIKYHWDWTLIDLSLNSSFLSGIINILFKMNCGSWIECNLICYFDYIYRGIDPSPFLIKNAKGLNLFSTKQPTSTNNTQPLSMKINKMKYADLKQTFKNLNCHSSSIFCKCEHLTCTISVQLIFEFGTKIRVVGFC